jgi:DNA-binding PadR family transcriptional regulator
MSLEAAIMGFLADEPHSGYELKTRCFDQLAEPFWTADQAQIYRTLERLRASRMVACARKRQLGKPDRKVYRLTDVGAAALTTWLTCPTPLTSPRHPFLLKVLFSAQLTDRDIVASLIARRNAHQCRLDDLRREAVVCAGQPELPSRDRILRRIAFDGAIAHERASIDWLDDTIEAIDAGGLPAAQSVGAFGRSGLPETGSA